MTGFKSPRTVDLETELEHALAAQTVQDIHHELHLSYANDRERH